IENASRSIFNVITSDQDVVQITSNQLSSKSSQSKKRVTLKGYEKQELCLQKQQNPQITRAQLATEFNIALNTVNDILKRKDYWLNIDPNSFATKSQRNRLPGFPLIEQALLIW
ncbi:8765_t:CDS:2, partial [Racocetra persica]